VIERWLLFLEGINSLPNELKAALARAGWDELALQGVANQVQGVIDAGIVQRQRMAEYESENTRCKTLAAECRQGYLTARGLILGGIRRHAPTRESELQDLLDL
jgi:hypothetical protein